MRWIAALLVLLGACESQGVPETQVLRWKPAVATESLPSDADDPAIWVHPRDPARSVIVGTNKSAAPAGALVVFDLAGRVLQTISGIDRPNNVDVRGNLVVVTERLKSAVRMFTIDPDTRRLAAAGTVPVFAGEKGPQAAPMGIALYRRGRDGALFAVLSRKAGPSGSYLWQYRVEAGPSLRLVRKFGAFGGQGEIEAVTVDDEKGFLYYADEGAGIRKYHADPDHPDAGKELALFGRSGYRGDREGLAIYKSGGGGFLISVDQIPGGSRYLLYRREGSAKDPHDHSEVVAAIEAGADSTDGIEATSSALGPEWPQGLLVVMNSGAKNFLYVPWGMVR